MSKTKTLFTVALLVLLGSMGAAQAQVTRVTNCKRFRRRTRGKEA